MIEDIFGVLGGIDVSIIMYVHQNAGTQSSRCWINCDSEPLEVYLPPSSTLQESIVFTCAVIIFHGAGSLTLLGEIIKAKKKSYILPPSPQFLITRMVSDQVEITIFNRADTPLHNQTGDHQRLGPLSCANLQILGSKLKLNSLRNDLELKSLLAAIVA